MKRKLIVVAVIAALLLGGWYLYRRNLVATNGFLRTTGTVEGREVNITTRVSGRIATLKPREGERVAAGETVLTLDNSDLQAQTRSAEAGLEKAQAQIRVDEAQIASLKAGLAAASAEILTARANLNQSRVQAGNANLHLERLQNLYEQNGVAKDTLDVATTTRDSAVAAVQAAEARVESAQAARLGAEAQLKMAGSQLGLARAGINQARAELAYQQAKLAETTVASPINGTVVYRALEVGETVAPEMTVLTLVDYEHLTIRVDIDESRLGSIKPGDPALIRLDDRPNLAFKGRIAAINRYGDFATQRDVAAGRQDIRTFRVTIVLEPGQAGLNPGMTVRVEIPNPQGAR